MYACSTALSCIHLTFAEQGHPKPAEANGSKGSKWPLLSCQLSCIIAAGGCKANRCHSQLIKCISLAQCGVRLTAYFWKAACSVLNRLRHVLNSSIPNSFSIKHFPIHPALKSKSWKIAQARSRKFVWPQQSLSSPTDDVIVEVQSFELGSRVEVEMFVATEQRAGMLYMRQALPQAGFCLQEEEVFYKQES